MLESLAQSSRAYRPRAHLAACLTRALGGSTWGALCKAHMSLPRGFCLELGVQQVWELSGMSFLI